MKKKYHPKTVMDDERFLDFVEEFINAGETTIPGQRVKSFADRLGYTSYENISKELKNMGFKVTNSINERFLRSSKLLVESGFKLLTEEIEDVRGKLKKKIENEYIAALASFKQNIVKEIEETVYLQNSNIIKTANEIKDKINREQLKYLIKALEQMDSYSKEARVTAKTFEKLLLIAQRKISTHRDLYEFLESTKKSDTLKQWTRLVNILGKSKDQIDNLSEHAPSTKELIKGYIDVLEAVEESIDKYISTLNIMKEKLQMKHTPVSPDEIESDEDLREQFISRLEIEVEKQLGKKMSEEDFRLIDIALNVMKGDSTKEKEDIRKKLMSRDTESKSARSEETKTGMISKRQEAKTGY